MRLAHHLRSAPLRWAWVLAVSSIVGCAAAENRVDREFRRCLDQQATAPSPGCWRLFLDQFGDVASPGQRKAAEELSALEGAEGGTETDRLAILPGANGDDVEFPAPRVDHDGCYAGFRPTGVAVTDVEALVERCGRAAGLVPLTERKVATQQQQAPPQVFQLPLRSDRCYRVFAAADQGMQDLDALVMDTEGNVLAFDTFVDPAPILGPRAPFCPATTGEHRLIFAAERGGGRYTFQVWQGTEDSMRAIRAAVSEFPQNCDQEADKENYGVAQVGLYVVLGKHREVGGQRNWRDDMEPYAGSRARITSLPGLDAAGCPVVSVDADGGTHFWRIRDLHPAETLDPNEVNPHPPGGRAPVPRRCGYAPHTELYGPIGIGSEVVLARHSAVGGDENWNEEMDPFVGRSARVEKLRGVDDAGCPVVGVDVDNGSYAWRIRDLRPGMLGGYAPSIGNSAMPADPPSGSLTGLEAVVSAIESIPNPTTSPWDDAVSKILVDRFDQDGSGVLDTVAELHSVPCVVWQSVNARVQMRSRVSSLRVTYGFDPELIYVGAAVGIAEELRELAALRLIGCGL